MKQSRFNVIDKGNQPTLAYNSYSGNVEKVGVRVTP